MSCETELYAAAPSICKANPSPDESSDKTCQTTIYQQKYESYAPERLIPPRAKHALSPSTMLITQTSHLMEI